MTTRGISRNRITVPRRPRQWGITHISGSIIAATEAASLTVNLSGGVEVSLGQTMANWTISAIRLRLTFHNQATAVVGDSAFGAWGIVLVGSDAFIAGPASLPNPAADDADWIAHGSFSTVAEIAAVVSAPRNSEVVINNDSMRKVRENNQKLLIILRATVLQDPVTINISGRVLFLLR